MSGKSLAESCAGNSKRADHDLNSDELKRDVGHGCNDAGDCDREGKPAIAEAATHKIACRDVTVLMADVPKPRKNQKQNWIDDDCIGHRKEGDSAGAEGQRRNRDERIGRIEIAADEKPRDDGPEAPAAQSPFMQKVKIAFPPICGGEAKPCNQAKQQYEYGKCDPVYVLHGTLFPAWLLGSRRGAPFLGFRCEVNNGRQNCADDHPQKLVPVEEWNTAKGRFSPVEQWGPQNENVLDDEEQVPPAPRALIMRSVHLWPPW